MLYEKKVAGFQLKIKKRHVRKKVKSGNTLNDQAGSVLGNSRLSMNCCKDSG